MKKYLKLCAVTLLLLPLVACSKPPSCASDEALENIRSQVTATENFPPTIYNSAQEAVAANAKAVTEARNNKWAAFVRNVKFTLESVTSSGYREQSKSYYCQAELKMQIDKVVQSRSIEYLIQAVESKDKAYELTIEDQYGRYMAFTTLLNLSDIYDANVAKTKKQAFMSNPNNFKLPIKDVAALKGQPSAAILGIPQFKYVADTYWDARPQTVGDGLTRSTFPIGETAHYYVGFGCAKDNCSGYRVLWGVRKDTGLAWILVMYGQGAPGTPKPESIGLEVANGIVQVPPEVSDWIGEQNSAKQERDKFGSNPDNFKMPVADIAKLVGQPSASILEIPKVKLWIDNVWYERPTFVADRLTQSLTPIEDTGSYYVGWGCMQGKYDTDRVLWAVNKDTGRIMVWILFVNGETGHGVTQTAGVPLDQKGVPVMPKEVQDWIYLQKVVRANPKPKPQ